MVERSLHGSFFEEYGITHETFAATPVQPASHHYVSYLTATAFAEPYEWCSRPCFPASGSTPRWGRDIHGRAAAGNPYQAWIDTYAGEDFHTAVAAMIAATDEAAAGAPPALVAPHARGLHGRDAARVPCSGTARTGWRPGRCEVSRIAFQARTAEGRRSGPEAGALRSVTLGMRSGCGIGLVMRGSFAGPLRAVCWSIRCCQDKEFFRSSRVRWTGLPSGSAAHRAPGGVHLRLAADDPAPGGPVRRQVRDRSGLPSGPDDVFSPLGAKRFGS